VDARFGNDMMEGGTGIVGLRGNGVGFHENLLVRRLREKAHWDKLQNVASQVLAVLDLPRYLISSEVCSC
jgi:hypothetical protein